MNRKGFTLLELMMVLFIIGFLSAASFKAIEGTLKSSKISSSTDKVSSVVKEVGEYAARAKRIPNTSSNFQIVSGFEIYSAVKTHNDSFGQPMLYIPDTQLTKVDENGRPIDICSVNSTDMTVQKCSSSSCTTPDETINNVAFAAVSGGSNKNIQISYDNGILQTFTTDISVDGYAADKSQTEAYDDIVKWMTLDELKQAAGCDGSALNIIQPKIPPLIHQNDYSYTLTLKGGVGPYKWCAESDTADVRNTLNYKGTSGTDKNLNAISSCTSGDYVTGNSLILETASTPSIDDNAPASAKVKVYVEDSKGTKAERQYSLAMLKSYNLALAAKDSGGNGYTPNAVEGFGDFYTFVSDNYKEFDKIIDLTDDEIAFHKSPTVHLTGQYGCSGQCWMTSVSAFYSCDIPTASSNKCLAFTKGKLSTFFKVTPKFNDNNSTPYGFTFTIAKSYRYSGSDMVSTINDVGAGFEGLGYSNYQVTGSNSYYNDSAALFGDNLALEFDMGMSFSGSYPNAKNDPAGISHMAITSHSGGYAYSTHNSVYNDQCPSSGNSNGCFKNTGVYEGNGNHKSEVPVLDEKTPFYIRLEAISGCNASGTVCDGKTTSTSDPHDYVCSYAWKISESTYNAYTTDKDGVNAFNDIYSFYVYDYITKANTPIPGNIGSPTVSDCYRDNVAGATLDSVRYGFTVATSYKSGQYDISFTNFKLNLQYY